MAETPCSPSLVLCRLPGAGVDSQTSSPQKVVKNLHSFIPSFPCLWSRSAPSGGGSGAGIAPVPPSRAAAGGGPTPNPGQGQWDHPFQKEGLVENMLMGLLQPSPRVCSSLCFNCQILYLFREEPLQVIIPFISAPLEKYSSL